MDFSLGAMPIKNRTLALSAVASVIALLCVLPLLAKTNIQDENANAETVNRCRIWNV